MRHKNSKRKRGQHRKDMGDVDWHVPIDTERAQVPANASILGKVSKLSTWSTNFFNNFAAKTTGIVPAPLMTMVIWRRPIPRAR